MGPLDGVKILRGVVCDKGIVGVSVTLRDEHAIDEWHPVDDFRRLGTSACGPVRPGGEAGSDQ